MVIINWIITNISWIVGAGTTILAVFITHTLAKKLYRSQKEEHQIQRTKTEISQRDNKINELLTEIEKLKGIEEFENSIIHDPNGFLTKISESGTKEYFCENCWESDHIKKHVTISGKFYHCQKCKAHGIFDQKLNEAQLRKIEEYNEQIQSFLDYGK